MDIITILIILVVVLLVIIVGVWGLVSYIKYRFFRFGRKFANDIIGYVIKEVRELPQAQKIMEYDKVLDRVLGELGYEGSLGDKMKKYGKHFKDENAIWEAHKQRNKFAHEMGHKIDDKSAKRISAIYEREIEGLLKKKMK